MQGVILDLVECYATNLTKTEINRFFTSDVGYVTPKVDIRSVVFNQQGKLLFLQEKSDATWALPGGWADVGYSPGEIAVKETFEEAGIQVTAEKLIQVVDKAKHPYPPSLEYVYKFFILCEAQSFAVSGGIETSQARFFSRREVSQLKLSLERNTLEDIWDLFSFYENPWHNSKFD